MCRPDHPSSPIRRTRNQKSPAMDRRVPAYSAACKNCVWYTACLKRLSEGNDLTLIPGLGRSKRDVMIDQIPTVSDLSAVNSAAFITGKKTVFKGIGPDSLEKFIARARLITTKGAAYLSAPLSLVSVAPATASGTLPRSASTRIPPTNRACDARAPRLLARVPQRGLRQRVHILGWGRGREGVQRGLVAYDSQSGQS